jgi:hypothetical protein
MKDVEANGDLTSQIIKEKLAQMRQQEEANVPTARSTVAKEEVKPEAAETEKMWYEAHADEGHVYYWHIETGGKYGDIEKFWYLYFAETSDDSILFAQFSLPK